jgi:hypothetical protein
LKKFTLIGLGIAVVLVAATSIETGNEVDSSLSDAPFVSQPNEASMEEFSKRKQDVPVGNWNVAYVDEGSGPPVFLLHGCPFHAYQWRDVIPVLSRHYRVIAPDLLGLGDTQVRLTDDYRLPQDVEMVCDRGAPGRRHPGRRRGRVSGALGPHAVPGGAPGVQRGAAPLPRRNG